MQVENDIKYISRESVLCSFDIVYKLTCEGKNIDSGTTDEPDRGCQYLYQIQGFLRLERTGQ